MVKARSLGKIFPVDRIGYGLHFLTLTKKKQKICSEMLNYFQKLDTYLS